MSRVDDIITRARDSLADEAQTRWSRSRLLRLIDEAQKDLATKALLLRKKVQVKITAQINEYSLPADSYMLSRVVPADGEALPIVSHDVMDDLHNSWETDTGARVTKIVFDKVNPGIFKVYPIPTETNSGEIFINTDYGIIATVEGDIISGDLGDLFDISVTATDTATFNSVYGFTVGMEETTETLTCYYNYKTEDFLTTETLSIDDNWDKAIKHYVVGMCLRDDQDTQNRAIGNDELLHYANELKSAKQTSSTSNTTGANHQSTYNPGI